MQMTNSHIFNWPTNGHVICVRHCGSTYCLSWMLRRLQAQSLGLEVSVSEIFLNSTQSRLGLKKIWEGPGLGLVMNGKPKCLISVLDLSFLFYKLIFNCRNSLKLVLWPHDLWLALWTQAVSHAMHAVFSVFMQLTQQMHVFSSFCVTYLSSLWCRCSVHAITCIWQKRETALRIRTLYSIVNVVAVTKWTWLNITSATCSKVCWQHYKLVLVNSQLMQNCQWLQQLRNANSLTSCLSLYHIVTSFTVFTMWALVMIGLLMVLDIHGYTHEMSISSKISD